MVPVPVVAFSKYSSTSTTRTPIASRGLRGMITVSIPSWGSKVRQTLKVGKMFLGVF